MIAIDLEILMVMDIMVMEMMKITITDMTIKGDVMMMINILNAYLYIYI